MSASEITIAFRCGECGMTTLEKLNIFELSGSKKTFKCDCGQSKLSIEIASDNKLRIIAPCIVCENPHRFTVAPSLVFGKEIFLLQCPYTGIDVVFTGEKKQVVKALDISDKLLQTLMEESFDDGLDEEDEYYDDDDDYNDEDDDLDFNNDALDEDRISNCNCDHDCNHDCDCDHNLSEKESNHDTQTEAPRDISECDNPVITSEIIFLLRDMVTEGNLKCSCGSIKLAIGISYDSLIISCPACGKMKKLFTRSESDRARVEELDSLVLE